MEVRIYISSIFRVAMKTLCLIEERHGQWLNQRRLKSVLILIIMRDCSK